MERLKLERIGPVAAVVIETPPGHAPDRATRAGMIGLFETLSADAEIRALVLLATGTAESAEEAAGDPAATDGLAALCDALERLEIPVVYGLEGAVTAGGADIALAAHFRLAEPGVVLRWPDAAVGRLAGGGGTQRLTRIAGAGTALDCLLAGTPLDAAAAEAAGLVDGVVSGDLIEASVALAEKLAEAGAGPRRSRDRGEGLADRAAFSAAVSDWRKRLATRAGSAEARIVECVEAALVLPFEAGIGFELAAAEELNGSARSAALAHLRTAARNAALPDLAARSALKRIGLHGGGAVAADLACDLLAAGREVILSEPRPPELRAGLSRIGARLSGDVEAGHLTAAERTARLARLSSAARTDDLAGCDLVILGTADDAAALRAAATRRGGRQVLARILEGPFAIGVSAPGDQETFGLVRCGPVPAGRLMEIRPPAGALLGEVAALRDLAGDLGAQVAISRAGALRPMVGRLALALFTAAEHLLEDGATPRQIDRSLEAAGYATGVLRMVDAAGLDALREQRQQAAGTRDPRARYVTVLDRLCAAGRLGFTSQQGFHDYPDGIPEGVPSAEVEAIVTAAREAAGIRPRPLDAAEIVERCHLSLVLEGLRLLADGVARRPSDIDIAAVYGLGYPRETGGPMYRAGRDGLEALRERLCDLAEAEDALFWTPPRLLDRLITEGRSFDA